MGSFGSSVREPPPPPPHRSGTRPLRPTLCNSPSPHSYYKGIRQMVQVSDQDMNTHLAEISRVRVAQGTHKLSPPQD